MTETVVTASRLGFSFGNGRTIFRDVGFELPRSGILAIIGQNGAGKTTLLKTLLGLLRPSEGEVGSAGITGYVPQSLRTAVNFSVLEMVVMGRARTIGLFRSPKKSDFRSARKCLGLLGIGRLADRGFASLSGGERQLVLIAQALASECSLLVLDEPAAALDFHNQEAMLRLLRDLARGHGVSVIFTTHNPQHAALVADQTLAMVGDARAVCGRTDEILVDDSLRRIYGMDVRNVAFTVDGAEARSVLPVFRLAEENAA